MGRFTSGQKSPRYQLDKRLGERRGASLDAVAKKKNPYPSREFPTSIYKLY
jgi:hypothetical protein